MKQILFIITLAFTFLTPANAQVKMEDSLICVYPYFDKNDTMVYRKFNYVVKYQGTDSIEIQNDYIDVQLVCKKANDKKGYTIEQTLLDYQDNLEDKHSSLKNKVTRAINKAEIGRKFTFTIDGQGENIQIENFDKVTKDLKDFYTHTWDSIVEASPMAVTALPKNTMVENINNLTKDQETFCQWNNLELLFDLHGRNYDYGVVEEREIEQGEYNTRPGILRFTAVGIPESEDKEVESWDGYVVLIEDSVYLDSKEILINYIGTALETEKLDELIRNNELPTEGVQREYYQYEYFWDGWPKEIIRRKEYSISGAGVLSIENVEWTDRMTHHKK